MFYYKMTLTAETLGLHFQKKVFLVFESLSLPIKDFKGLRGVIQFIFLILQDKMRGFIV